MALQRHLGWIWASGRVLKWGYFHGRINRYSDKTRRASVKLLKDSTVKLILLAGDICENPGPTSVTHQCSVCQKKSSRKAQSSVLRYMSTMVPHKVWKDIYKRIQADDKYPRPGMELPCL